MSRREISLADCCDLITDGDHQPPPKSDSGVPFITISDFTPYNTLSFERGIYVPETYYDSLPENRKARKGDILYSVVGSFGIPILLRDHTAIAFQRHIALLRPKPTLDTEYLYYAMLSREFYQQADAVALGAAQRTISLSSLRNMKLSVPSIEEQRKVARVLSAYDTLIENNRKQIKLLEEAAQRLYKEWFVDLRFPGHEHTPIVNGIPEGWRKTNIASVCTRIQSGGTPSRENKSCWQGGNVRWFKTKELADTWLFDSEEFISEDALSSSAAKLFPKGTILMAIYASPTLGRLGILSKQAACNQAALGLIPDKTKCSCEWLFMQLYFLRDEFNAVAAGAGQQNISAKIVKEKTIILPHYEHLMEYTRLAEPMFENMRILTLSNLHLTEARDRLLPKLMSGEIAIK